MVKTRSNRAVLYARISQDATGEGAGVARQMEDLHALAVDRGWDVVADVTDNDVSAWSGAKRPGYEHVMALVDAGLVDVIGVWHLSRLWRSRKQRAAGMEALADKRVSVVAVRGPELDFGSATGRMVAAIMGEVDTHESDVKSERVARATLQRVQSGRHSGDLGYGWRKTDDGSYEIDPVEADVVREVVKRLCAGESVRAVTADLNGRRVPPPGASTRRKHAPDNPDGMEWGQTSVRKLALRASNAGLVVHKGAVIGKGTWPALITARQHATVTQALTRKGRSLTGNPDGDNTRKHMLSWTVTATCGVCGGRLRSHTHKPRNPNHSPQTLYTCVKGCVGRNQAAVDALVGDVVVERLSRPDVADVLAVESTSAAVVELEALRGRLGDAVEAFKAGKLSAVMLGVVESDLAPRIRELEVTASTPTPVGAVNMAAVVRDPRKVWDRMTAAQRLAVVEAIGLRVRVLRTGRRGAGFDPASVGFEWVTS